MTASGQARILVTGAYGFVGSNLCGHLVSRGFECHALDLAKGEAPYSRFFSWDELDAIDFAQYAAVVHLAGKAHDLKKVADDIAYFAEKEGLSAHARSATVRFREIAITT